MIGRCEYINLSLFPSLSLSLLSSCHWAAEDMKPSCVQYTPNWPDRCVDFLSLFVAVLCFLTSLVCCVEDQVAGAL